jgi:hypothetical protein
MFEQAFKNIDDILRREAGARQNSTTPEQTSWLLFLKYLDGLEEDKADEAALDGKKYNPRGGSGKYLPILVHNSRVQWRIVDGGRSLERRGCSRQL